MAGFSWVIFSASSEWALAGLAKPGLGDRLAEGYRYFQKHLGSFPQPARIPTLCVGRSLIPYHIMYHYSLAGEAVSKARIGDLISF